MIDARNYALEEAAAMLDGMADLYDAHATRERAAIVGTRGLPHAERAEQFERDCITLRDAAARVRGLKRVIA